MKVLLQKANESDLQLIQQLQIQSFLPLLEKYQDYNFSPACESKEKIHQKFHHPDSTYYLIYYGSTVVGALRIFKKESGKYRISPLFIIPKFQKKGIAQQALSLIEKQYPDARFFSLDMIKQEKSNCYLSEKMGYQCLADEKIINAHMILSFYEKPTSKKQLL